MRLALACQTVPLILYTLNEASMSIGAKSFLIRELLWGQSCFQVRAIFAKHIEMDVSQTQPDDKLVEELRMDALDSMSTIEFVLELEEHFNVSIPEKAAREMRTLRDLTSFIARELKSKRSC